MVQIKKTNGHQMKNQIATAADVLSALRKRLRTDDDRDLAEFLGVSRATISNWTNSEPRLTGSKVAAALVRVAKQSRKGAFKETIRPIVEMYELNSAPQAKGDGWVMWDKTAGRYGAELRAQLEKTSGVYIFYDTSGRALYVGKAKGTKLWGEMNNAFNRHRAVQTVKLTKHPVREQAFVPGDEQHRQIRPRQLVLADMAWYVSAYAVATEMIDEVEALLVRAFPNNVLNVRMEKFGSGTQPKRKRTVIRKPLARSKATPAVATKTPKRKRA